MIKMNKKRYWKKQLKVADLIFTARSDIKKQFDDIRERSYDVIGNIYEYLDYMEE
jgi:hypothetical protein